jgi:hypothetical protein
MDARLIALHAHLLRRGSERLAFTSGVLHTRCRAIIHVIFWGGREAVHWSIDGSIDAN